MQGKQQPIKPAGSTARACLRSGNLFTAFAAIVTAIGCTKANDVDEPSESIAVAADQTESPIDYDSLERRLIKEPDYRSLKPLYGLLVFGRQAHLTMWVVLDDDTVYLDRNGNGDLTEPGERFDKEEDCQDIAVPGPDGKTRCVIMRFRSNRSLLVPRAWKVDEAKGVPRNLVVEVRVRGAPAFHEYCDMSAPSDDPQKAPLAHFDGPLTIGVQQVGWKVPARYALRKGENPPELCGCVVGTMSESQECWVVVESCHGYASRNYRFPRDVHPTADVEFPPLSPDDSPLKTSYTLGKFCCGAVFAGPIRVPDSVGIGSAKERRFDTWPAGAVRPSTIELPILDPSSPAGTAAPQKDRAQST